MSDTIQQVKDRLDLADFIRGYVQLTPAGKNLKGLCPFHKEKTASFIVSPDRQIWHCFGCGAGGDLIGFMMRYENLEFFEALKILAEKAGVDIARAGTQDQRKLNVLYEANGAAKEFFKKNLNTAALDYLKSRGLKGEIVQEFELGFAPNSYDALSRDLVNAGFSVGDLEKAGLIFKTERGTYCDRFRNRIMFPLYNQFGKVVGFTGRIMPGGEDENIGKYVNSPETPIFNKSKVLYGLDKSKNHIRESRTAILMEGQMDFLMSWQDNVKNLAATSGTALTVDHLKSLKRLADNLILSFDQDVAGQNATERTIDLASSLDFSVKVLRLPEDLKAKDPADVVLTRPGVLNSLISQAQPAMKYYFGKYLDKKEENFKKNIRVVLSKVKSIYSPVERAQWLKEVSYLTGVAEPHLVEEMDNLKPEPTLRATEENAEQNNQLPQFSRKDLISQKIISLALNHKDLSSDVILHSVHLPSQYQEISRYYFDQQKISLASEIRLLADLISLRSSLEIVVDSYKAKKEIAELFRQLRIESLKHRRQEISLSIQEAERKGSDLVGLLVEKQKIAQELHQLELSGPSVV